MSLSRSAPRYDDGPEVVGPSTLEPVAVTERGLDAPHEHVGVPYKTYADYQYSTRPNVPERRTVCGMPTSTFILAVALVVVVIVAGVGGGVGGSIAVQNAKGSCTATPTASPTTSTSTVATSSSAFAVPADVLLPLDCPGLDSKPQSSTFGHQTSAFEMYCTRSPVYNYNTAILGINVYSLQDCLQACVSFNHYANSNNCTAALFYANLTRTREANCVLSKETGLDPNTSDSQDNYVVTGLIGTTSQ